VTSPGDQDPAAQLWSAYLDAVEDAARAVEEQTQRHGAPVLPPLKRPDTPWPAALEPRRRDVLATLASVQATVEDRRDRTAAALASLPRRMGRGVGYGDGERLDVLS
jgi:hypothetical protein